MSPDGSHPAIRVEGLGKSFRVGGSRAYGNTSLRERIGEVSAAALRRVGVGPPAAPDDSVLFPALDDLTFTIEPGETVGFIGQNGAGKSTLLKILSRITPPTRGWAEIRGRVGSLLEVGTGFHSELTGRENVYLNGAILGMRRHEIERRFDQIVAFAEVERFLDLPIKRYSSGMAVRLAFAVAAHLETEILIVDEVLAVGDAAFQRKSVGRMGEVASEGRTVLFVSHNMGIIQSLCERGIVLQGGRMVADGPIEDAVRAYLQTLDRAMSIDLLDRGDRSGHGLSLVRALQARGPDGGPVVAGRPATFTVDFTELLPSMSCQLRLFNDVGTPVCTFDSGIAGPDDHHAGADRRMVCVVEDLPLVPGTYRIDVVLHGGGHRQDEIAGAASFDVGDGLIRGRPVVRSGAGNVHIDHRWIGPEP